MRVRVERVLATWVICAAFFADVGAAPSSCERRLWSADSWQAPPSNCSFCGNIVPFFWITASAVSSNVTAAAAAAVNATRQNRYPSLFSWDVHLITPSDPSDNIFGPGGGPNCSETGYSNFSGLWWDAGTAATRDRFEAFFKAYESLGGSVVRFVVDTEEWMNNWALFGNPGPPPGCHQQRATAIQQDPRFPSVLQDLQQHGFTVGNLSDPNALFEAVWKSPDQYNIFNDRMLRRTASYFNQSLWEPLHARWPAAQLSNYEYMIYNASASRCVPDANGGAYCKQGLGLQGALNGDVSTPSIYMVFGTGFEVYATANFNVTAYPQTPFNAFRLGIMTVRSLVIAASPTRGGSVTPVRPWVAPRSWETSLVNNSVFYDEAIRHMGLTGVSDFNFWNSNHNGSDVESLAALLLELDAHAGCTQRTWVFPDCLGAPASRTCPEAVVFDQGHVLTGIEAGGDNGDRRRFRLTVAVGSVKDYLKSSPGSRDLQFSIPSLNAVQGFHCLVNVPGGSGLSDGPTPAPLDPSLWLGPGLWIDQPQESPSPTVTCASD